MVESGLLALATIPCRSGGVHAGNRSDSGPTRAAGVYFSDVESLRGMSTPVEFANRLGLFGPAVTECQRYGCAVVEFDVPPNVPCTLPTPYPGLSQGLTVGGAREWLLAGNLALGGTMTVRIIDLTGQGPRNFQLPL